MVGSHFNFIYFGQNTKISTKTPKIPRTQKKPSRKSLGRGGGSAPTKSDGEICHLPKNVHFRDVFPMFLPKKLIHNLLKLVSILYELVGQCFRKTWLEIEVQNMHNDEIFLKNDKFHHQILSVPTHLPSLCVKVKLLDSIGRFVKLIWKV